MEQRLRPFLAELFGTFVLVLIGAGTVCAGFLPRETTAVVGGPALAAALAEGLALAALLSATLYVSPGCLNPALTLGLWVTRRIEGKQVLTLWTAQLLGAVLGGLVVRGLFSDGVLLAARLGTPHLRALVDSDGGVPLRALGTGVGLEMLFTAFVSVTAFATLFDERAPRVGGLLVGLAQVAVVLFGYHLTGGSANPARWFGTMIWQYTLGAGAVEQLRPLADHSVYWVGPLFGALAGCLIYARIIAPSGSGT